MYILILLPSSSGLYHLIHVFRPILAFILKLPCLYFPLVESGKEWSLPPPSIRWFYSFIIVLASPNLLFYHWFLCCFLIFHFLVCIYRLCLLLSSSLPLFSLCTIFFVSGWMDSFQVFNAWCKSQATAPPTPHFSPSFLLCLFVSFPH